MARYNITGWPLPHQTDVLTFILGFDSLWCFHHKTNNYKEKCQYPRRLICGIVHSFGSHTQYSDSNWLMSHWEGIL